MKQIVKSGMEPWFEFWEKVKYAIHEIWKEHKKRKEYNLWLDGK